MITETVFDLRLLEDIPAWVIENIQAVSSYMKVRGHEDWQIAGIYSAAAHAREVAAMQAKIDALMLEYCPDEMTTEQVETWGKSQRVVKRRIFQSDNTMPLCIHCCKPTMHSGNVCYSCSHMLVRE